jgi:hypothetical protein
MISPKVPNREPTLGRVENRAERPIIARLAKSPTIPISISRMASMAIPTGREGLRIMKPV